MSHAYQPRVEYNLNRGWKFHLGDAKDAFRTEYDDSSWEKTNLPHSFSIPYFLSNRFYVGYGWYRKNLLLPKEWDGQKIFLDFDGVFQEIKLFVNGQFSGSHRGGYTGFRIDITPFLKFGEKNVISAQVNNIWDPTLAPRSGEHVFSGGIYRNVRLVVSNPIHIDWYGTFVTTPNITKEKAPVNVKTDLVNQGNQDCTVQLETMILDQEGKTLSSKTDSYKIEKGKTIQVEQNLTPIQNPKLWSPDTPYQYQIRSIVKVDQKTVDGFITNFGCRWFKWDKDTGFWLNGERRYLRGANVHQDRAGWGDAATDAAFARDIAYMKEIGFEVIRGSHYPHAPSFVEACDRQGMLFWSELCFWGTASFGKAGHWRASSAYPENEKERPAFEESVMTALSEMIRIHRNSPSILCWSMCNEVFFTRQQDLGLVRDFLKRLVELSHKLDPTRLAACGGVQRGNLDHCGDIAGYNGDGASIRDFQNPGIPNIVSEYGASRTGYRPDRFFAGFDNNITGKREFEWRSGEIRWCGFDHGSIAGNYGIMGVMDYFRLPKRSWYWYRENYAGVPHPEWAKEGIPAEVKLTSSSNVIKHADGTDDVQLFATILDAEGNEISNSPDVTLRIVSGPGEFPTGREITFSQNSDIVICDGKCSIDMRAYYAGDIVVEAISSGLKKSTLTIKALNAPEFTKDSPIVTNRPYHKYTEKDENANNSTIGVDMAFFKPTRASSSKQNHSSSLAVDSNDDTSWQPDDNDQTPWFSVTPERFIMGNFIECDLGTPVKSYTIDCSEDKENWTVLSQYNGDGVTSIRCKTNIQKEASHYRITFPNGKNIILKRFSVYTAK